MNIVSLGMQNLKVWELLYEEREINRDDNERLEKSLAFLDRVMSAITYVEEGEVEGLQETAFDEAYLTCNTLRQLETAQSLPSIREHLKEVRSAVQDLLDHNSLDKGTHEKLVNFFSLIGNSLLSEGKSNRTIDGLTDPAEANEALAPPVLI